MAQYTLADEKKRKQAAGIPLNNGVAPKPVPAAPAPAVKPDYSAELARKAAAGIPLANPTAESQAAYDKLRAGSTAAPAAVAPAGVNPAAPLDRGKSSAGTRVIGEQRREERLNPSPAPLDPGQVTPMANYPPAPAASANPDMEKTIRDSYMRDIESQTQTINQQLAKAIQASELAVNQNNQQLQEQIKSLQEQKVQLDGQAAQLQNRRGGFYSGGLDYQLGGIAKETTEATGNAQRDVAARNADIYKRNATLAEQAAESIKTLKNAAPDKIRELVRQAMNDNRQFELQEGALTGVYKGQLTAAQKNAEQALKLQYAEMMGRDSNGKPTQDAINAQRAYENDLARLRQSYTTIMGYDTNGKPTADQKRWQAEFDLRKYESDQNYARQVRQDAIQQGNWEKAYELDEKRFGLDEANTTWSQAFQEANARKEDERQAALLQQNMTEAERSTIFSAANSINNSGLVSPIYGDTSDPTKVTGYAVPSEKADAAAQYIIKLGLSDNATDALMYQYGLGKYVKK